MYTYFTIFLRLLAYIRLELIQLDTTLGGTCIIYSKSIEVIIISALLAQGVTNHTEDEDEEELLDEDEELLDEELLDEVLLDEELLDEDAPVGAHYLIDGKDLGEDDPDGLIVHVRGTGELGKVVSNWMSSRTTLTFLLEGRCRRRSSYVGVS